MIDNDQLKDLLLKENYLTANDIKTAEKIASSYKMTLADALLSEGLITKDLLGAALAEKFGVPYLDLKKEKIVPEYLEMIPEAVARTFRFVPVDKVDGKIRLAMVDPADLSAIHLAEKRLGERIEGCLTLEQDYEDALSYYGGSLADEFSEIIKLLDDKDLSLEDRDEATIKIVDLLLEKGYSAKASDIHIEPGVDKIVVRFRIDGVMHKVLTMDKTLADLVMTRIKVMSKLRTDEHRSAQDGKLKFEYSGKDIDVRVSIVPITGGENTVLRLLSAKTHNLNLPNVGLGEADFKKVKRAIVKPHGMILVTGPTGSGKTTTLYAVLNILNKEEVHIATIEDPVEYAIDGISQIQVDNKTNLTFAAGLRSILRQDPDIIMIGEIRDSETANIAVNSALTGHLVLSTLHTNDSPTALPRLLDMGIEPFLIASTVNMVIAQRLVRKNCDRCRVSSKLSEEELLIIENEPAIQKWLKSKNYKDAKKINVFRGKGCRICDYTGYQGRIGIFEILNVDNKIRKMIMEKKDSSLIMEEARKNGMTTMLEDGLEKVLEGVTSIEEVLRVTRD